MTRIGDRRKMPGKGLSILSCWAALALAPAMIAGCARAHETDAQGFTIEPDFERSLQQRLLDAKPGEVIDIPAGKYALSRSLSLAANGVTIRGQGMDKTVLSFARQISGAEGMLVTGDDFTIEDLAIEDSKGDALKINGVRNSVIRRVRAEWTGGAKSSNGAYGLYPVQVTNVLIEGAVVKGASDAGIYVGQSTNVIVRNNRATGNVAGIEIENSTGADVYGNVASGNTGGILVFNLPDLPVPGSRTRIFQNRVESNNHVNFAAAGSAVSSVPAGSGVIVNSNDMIEIFDNDLKNNDTANVIISSYYSTGFDGKRGMAAAYDPFPEDIFVTGNRFEGGGTNPGARYAPLKAMAGGALPAVVWDGFVNPARKTPAICVRNPGAQVLNADAPGKFAKARLDTGLDCAPATRLPAIALPAAMTKDGRPGR